MSNRHAPARLLLVADRPRTGAIQEGAPHVRRFRLARVRTGGAASPAGVAKRTL